MRCRLLPLGLFISASLAPAFSSAPASLKPDDFILVSDETYADLWFDAPPPSAAARCCSCTCSGV